jgi:hypothetical protein
MFFHRRQEEDRRLRVTIHDGARAFLLRLEGCFPARDVGEVEACWRTAESTIAGREFVVDLSRLRSLEFESGQLLARMHAAGARFIARTPEIVRLVDAITSGRGGVPGSVSA